MQNDVKSIFKYILFFMKKLIFNEKFCDLFLFANKRKEKFDYNLYILKNYLSIKCPFFLRVETLIFIFCIKI